MFVNGKQINQMICIHAWESRDLCCGKQPNEFGGVAPTKSKF